MKPSEFEALIAEQTRGTPVPDDAAAFQMLLTWAQESEHWGRRNFVAYCRPGDGARQWIVEGSIMNFNDDWVKSDSSNSSLYVAARAVIWRMGKLESGE